MNRSLPHSRNRARAIAISDSIEAKRMAGVRAMLVAFASLAATAEVAILVHRLWARS